MLSVAPTNVDILLAAVIGFLGVVIAAFIPLMFANRRQLKAVHVLVNSNMSNMILKLDQQNSHIMQLEASLVAARHQDVDDHTPTLDMDTPTATP